MVSVKGQNKGNKCAQKLTTPELRQEAYRQYCDHLAHGYPKQAWCFEHPDLTLCWKTMERYIKDYADEFPLSQRTRAESKGLKWWIDEGKDMMRTQDRCQPAIFQIMMRNIYGWDKETIEEKVDREAKEKTMLEQLLSEVRKPVEKK